MIVSAFRVFSANKIFGLYKIPIGDAGIDNLFHYSLFTGFVMYNYKDRCYCEVTFYN